MVTVIMFHFDWTSCPRPSLVDVSGLVVPMAGCIVLWWHRSETVSLRLCHTWQGPAKVLVGPESKGTWIPSTLPYIPMDTHEYSNCHLWSLHRQWLIDARQRLCAKGSTDHLKRKFTQVTGGNLIEEGELPRSQFMDDSLITWEKDTLWVFLWLSSFCQCCDTYMIYICHRRITF